MLAFRDNRLTLYLNRRKKGKISLNKLVGALLKRQFRHSNIAKQIEKMAFI